MVHDRVAGSGERRQRLKLGSPSVLARRLVGEQPVDADVLELPVGILVEGADPNIADAPTLAGQRVALRGRKCQAKSKTLTRGPLVVGRRAVRLVGGPERFHLHVNLSFGIDASQVKADTYSLSSGWSLVAAATEHGRVMVGRIDFIGLKDQTGVVPDDRHAQPGARVSPVGLMNTTLVFRIGDIVRNDDEFVARTE